MKIQLIIRDKKLNIYAYLLYYFYYSFDLKLNNFRSFYSLNRLNKNKIKSKNLSSIKSLTIRYTCNAIQVKYRQLPSH